MSITLISTTEVTETTVTEQYKISEHVVWERRLYPKNFKKQIENCSLGADPKIRKQYGHPILVHDPLFKKFISKENPFHGSKFGENWLVSNTPSLEQLQTQGNKVYFFYIEGHLLFDVNLNIVPIPIVGDYIESRALENSHNKNLREFRKELLKRDDIIEISEVLPVPYYNNEDGGREYIHVKLLPKEDKYKEMYNLVKNKQYFSTDLKKMVLSGNYDLDVYDHLGFKPFEIK